jgi:hypothetical protein
VVFVGIEIVPFVGIFLNLFIPFILWRQALWETKGKAETVKVIIVAPPQWRPRNLMGALSPGAALGP